KDAEAVRAVMRVEDDAVVPRRERHPLGDPVASLGAPLERLVVVLVDEWIRRPLLALDERVEPEQACGDIAAPWEQRGLCARPLLVGVHERQVVLEAHVPERASAVLARLRAEVVLGEATAAERVHYFDHGRLP